MKNRSHLLFKRSKSVSNAIVLRFSFIRHDGTVERERSPRVFYNSHVNCWSEFLATFQFSMPLGNQLTRVEKRFRHHIELDVVHT